MLTGKDIMTLGFKPAPWFRGVIEAYNNGKLNEATLRAKCEAMEEAYQQKHRLDLRETPIEPQLNFIFEEENENLTATIAHMREIGKLPNVVATALMPDAHPSEQKLGVIPVGGVVAAKDALFPSMHSADVCCSLAASYFYAETLPKAILDAALNITHFGAGGRKDQFPLPLELEKRIKANPLLVEALPIAKSHFGTQGDGNHFLYLGKVKNDQGHGHYALVTHHGSRGLGAHLYKKGKELALKHCAGFAHKTPGGNHWIDANSDEGTLYWEALQIVREWTKQNHFILHDTILTAINGTLTKNFWNEHNFIFKRDDHYYHAKGATPAFASFAPDTSGLTLIPFNMASPILVTSGLDNPHALGFAPHGAGRNLSRRKFEETIDDKEVLIKDTNKHIDIRWFSGHPDISELPEAYKSPAFIRAQIAKFKLCNIVEEITPIGSIMAGGGQYVKGKTGIMQDS
jgi:tRNA-splicing ligase RtcB (3'-phosphate/5'-hydroxy nucleic acid ligase)